MPLNRSRAVQYARMYAMTPNRDYHLYPVDCTNFVSQCLFAGGWQMIQGWYQSDRVWWYTGGVFGWRAASYTWAAAQNFFNFLDVSGRGTQTTDPRQLQPADVVQIRNAGGVYHTMIVTARAGNDLLLSYHTSNHLDRPLSDIQRGLSSTHSLIYWILS
ncbi:MAG TPA: amidase domain-containing protein [Gemmataceae bacterium]|nr:amidase domain-containing protein [Gemmataceae bacterium]